MNIMLANCDYRTHMTDEGNQLQEGLRHANWQLCGKGFDGIQDVKALVRAYKPEIAIVHDKRDWDPRQFWAFRRDLGYINMAEIHKVPNRLAVIKDAGSMVMYHQYFCEEIRATGVITYYHDRSIIPLSPFILNYPRYRTYHTVDADYVMAHR